MKFGELINVKDKRDLINTSESYSADWFLFGDNLVMPIMDLDLIEDVIENFERVRINYSYLLLTGLVQIQWAGEKSNNEIVGQLSLNDNHTDCITDWFLFEQKKQGYELKIKYGDIFLYIPRHAKYGQEYWTPWDTPNFKKNLSDLDIVQFQNLNWLPTDIQQELALQGDRQVLEFNQGTEEETKVIKENWVDV